MSTDLSARSSRQTLLQSNDETSLTSFPDPAESSCDEQVERVIGTTLETNQTDEQVPLQSDESPAEVRLPASAPVQNGSPMNGLLDVDGPSMFDEEEHARGHPETLASASDAVLQRIVDHHGALALVRRLSALLAERDAHVTALTRLAEDFHVPAERIAETADRASQAERRRRSLARAAAEEGPRPVASRSASYGGSVRSTGQDDANGGTIRGFTKLFGGTGRRRDDIQPSGSSARTASSSRSASRPRVPAKDRPRSIDVQSINSSESVGWTAALFGNGTSGATKGMASLNGTVHKRRSETPSSNAIPREPVEMSTRHDRDQLPPTLLQPNYSSSTSTSSKDPQEAEWNKFLLRVMRSREQAGNEESRGTGELIGASQFGTEGNNGRQKQEMLTRLVLGGIPMRLRHAIWMELSNTQAIVQPEAYSYFLHRSESDKNAAQADEIDAILKDVPRTLTSQYDFYAEKGYDRLKRVLLAFVAKFPGLGYTQGLNMIAGYLLLAIPDESDAFWLLCNMVSGDGGFFPADYFSRAQALSAPICDNLVLRQYVREVLPRLAEHLDDTLDVDPSHTVPLSWFLTAFASVLPQNQLLRVWDVWLCAVGQRSFLFNVALALLAAHQKQLLACNSSSEYFAYMSSLGGRDGGGDGANGIGLTTSELIRQAFILRRKIDNVEVRRALEMKRLRRTASTDALYAPPDAPDGEGEAAS